MDIKSEEKEIIKFSTIYNDFSGLLILTESNLKWIKNGFQTPTFQFKLKDIIHAIFTRNNVNPFVSFKINLYRSTIHLKFNFNHPTNSLNDSKSFEEQLIKLIEPLEKEIL